MRRFPRPGPPPDASSARPRPPGNLPAEPNPLIGRADALAALTGRLETARLVTLTGTGGVGKSRLARHAASIMQDRFCDGVWLADLSTVRDPLLLDLAVTEALALADHTGRPPRTVLADHLADRELLLVLDGFEQLVDACADLTAALLRRAPRLRVLAVGRRPLGLTGEHTLPLAPLDAAEAAALFTDRAASVVTGFTATAAGAPRIAELCRRLDGIPLALELAAGRLRALSVEQLLDRLDDGLGLLTGTTRDVPPRHRALRTAIGWSHELCTPGERLLWARLSVFAGHFDLDAVEYVCAGPELPDETLLDVLGELVAQSVVIREESPAGVRYRLLETVRAYGAGWLAATGDADRLRRRHRDWYLGLAAWCEREWFSPRQAEVAARMEAELANVRRALEHCLGAEGEAHLGQYLAGTLWFYWVGCGRLAEGRHWLDRALERPGSSDDARLKALWVTGYVAVLQGDAAGALAALEECRTGAERAKNATAAAYALHRTGCLALVGDDMPRAETLLSGALERYREIGELNSNVLMGQVELAMAVAFQGDLERAERLCAEVQAVCAAHGERWTLAYAQFVLGFAAWTRGDVRRARQLLAECLVTDHTFHDLLGAVLAVEMLALVTADDGDAWEAAVLQGAAARIWPSVGLPLFGSRYFNAPHARCEERARRALGDARYEAAVRSGGGLELDAVVARVLGHGEPAVAPRQALRIAAPDTHEPAASPSAGGGETAG